MAKLGDRIVVLIDMDCFFCQVEAKLDPSLKGKPLAVVQYSSFGPGSIIAVNYEARDHGVTRHMKGPEAKEKCRDIVLVKVPPIRNKPDTSRYRKAGREVIDVLKQYCSVIERASVDEAYLDITDLVDKKLNSFESSSSQDQEIIDKLSNSFVVGHCDDDSNDEEKRSDGTKKWVEEAFDDLGDMQARKLAIAGIIVEEFRAQIWEQCEYRCSAGISYNKILAKLACGLHKPNKQTILPSAAVPGLYSSLPVKKVRNLGGKFGNIVVESLGCNVMADLLRFSLQDLQRKFDEKTGLWLWNIARGVDNEAVTNRLICKSIGASKNFPGKQAITKLEVLKQWANELAAELVDRLEQDKEENERRAVTMTVGYHYYSDGKVVSGTKVVPLPVYKVEKVASLCVDVITRATQKPISLVSMSASKFVPSKGSGDFVNYFKAGGSKQAVEQGPAAVVEENKKDKNVVEEVNDVDESSRNSDDLNVKYKNESKIKTYVKKETPNKSPGVKNNAIHSFFDKKSKETKEKEMDCIDVKLPDKKSSLLMDNNLAKTLDNESFKGSFFMNFLKDSNPLISNLVTSETSGIKSQKKLDFSHLRKEEDLDKHGDESPDLFDDCSSGAKDESDQLISDEEGDLRDDDEEENKEGLKDEEEEEEKEEEKQPSVLDQLKEIFPDLNNIDPTVVELLPPELQKEARALMKCKKISSPPATSSSNFLMKSSTGKSSLKEKTTGKNSIKEKTAKPTKKNSTKKKTTKNSTIEKTTGKTGKSTSKLKSTTIQNFFSKRRSNPVDDDDDEDDADVKRCDECGQMIEVERWMEHCDFHMAQNLQRAMNKSNNQVETSASSSASTSSILSKEKSKTLPSPSAKRKLSNGSLQATKKPRGIAAFLQQ